MRFFHVCVESNLKCHVRAGEWQRRVAHNLRSVLCMWLKKTGKRILVDSGELQTPA